MKKTIRDIHLDGRKVFVRCDFNVPTKKNEETGEITITDDKRIRATLDTINYLRGQNARIILCSHLGRPKGKVNNDYSLKPVGKRLSELLWQDVKMADDVVGESAKKLTSEMKIGDIVLLENVRFDEREEKNDPTFSKELAELAGPNGLFVNDAFGTAHRAHSSTAGIADYLPDAVSGFLMEKEIKYLGGALDNPERPFVVILGGAKVSDKIGVISNLLERLHKGDSLIIGGGMAYTFLKAQGHNIGNSKCEEDKLNLASDLLKKAEFRGVKVELPVDNHITKEFSNESADEFTNSPEVPDGYMGLDVGPKTIENFKQTLEKAKTVLWNGPLGVCEFPKYETGTKDVAQLLADSKAVTIVGGGDSIAAIESLGLADKMTHMSTGGGASLEFLEGKTLPGIACLQCTKGKNNGEKNTDEGDCR